MLHLDEALDLVPRLPDTLEREEAEMNIESLRGPMLIATDGFASCAAEASLRRALQIAGQRCTGREMPVAFGLAAVLEVRGEYQSSQSVLEAYLPDLAADSPYTAEWHHLLACSTFHQGQFAAALDHALRGLKAAPADGQSELLRPYGEHPRVECHTWAALALWFLGYPDQSLAHAEQAAAIVGTPRHGYAMANGTAQIAMVHQLRGETDASLTRAHAAVESGKRQGMPYRVAIGKAVAGWAHSQSSGEQEGVSEIREAIDMCDQIGANLDRPYFLGLLADALIRCRRLEEAEGALSGAIEQVRRSRSFFYEAELLRLRAIVCVHRASATEAKQLFEEALRTATAQGAKALQLRTLVSMVETYPSDVALRTLLRNARAELSEGSDLPDLKTATVLARNAVAIQS